MDLGTSDVKTPEDVDLLAPDQQKCPWPSYAVLRDQAPVWLDPRTGHYVISRFEDVRRILLDPQTFQASMPDADPTVARPELRAMYEANGAVLPGTTMNALDDPKHRQVRSLMDWAFRPKSVQKLDPYIEDLCQRLFSSFAADGEVDIVNQYASEIGLRTMTHIMGTPEQDGPMIKAWTDAFIQRLSKTMTPEEIVWSVEQEIEAQHYFQKIIDRVRAEPEDNLISDIVNGVVEEWGHGLSDGQIHIEILVDMFSGGINTTVHAIGSAVKILIERPDLWQALHSDPDKYLAVFIEEAIRTDGPQQAGPRLTSRDVEVAGTLIPAGSMVNLRWSAGNRDQRVYGDTADVIDLNRQSPRSHLGFGAGTHFCIGNAIARRQMWFALKTLLDNLESITFRDPDPEFHYLESYILRGLTTLPVRFSLKSDS